MSVKIENHHIAIFLLFLGLMYLNVFTAGYKKGFEEGTQSCVAWKIEKVSEERDGFSFGKSRCYAWQLRP